MRELLKIHEVADLFGVRQPTVRRWLVDGKLSYIRTPGGGIRIPADSFQLQWERMTGGKPEQAD